MKFKNILLLLAIFTLISCENEDIFNPEESVINLERKLPDERTGKPKCPPPVVSLSPCDQRFRFFIYRGVNGYQDLGNYEFRILDPSNNNTIIDSGSSLSYGQYTNTVNNMLPCQQYIFEFNDWCWGWTQIYVTSDGCGNVWLC